MKMFCYPAQKHPSTLLSIFIICLFLFASFTAAQERAAVTTWESIGPYGGWIHSLTINPTDGNTLYASPWAFPCPIFKSTDSGNTWSENSKVYSYIFNLYTHPGNPNSLYATAIGAIFVSNDGGSTWSSKNLPDGDAYLNDIVIDPDNFNTIHITGDGYRSGMWVLTYYKSTNNGNEWSVNHLVTDNYGYGETIALDPLNSSIVYIGGNVGSGIGGRVYKSTDGGINWTNITGMVSGGVNSILCDPATSNKVLAATQSGIYRSSDGGTSWTKNSGFLGSNFKLAFDPTNTSIIYSGAFNKVHRSSDGGNNWSSYTTGLYGGAPTGLCVHSTTTSTLLLSNTSGIFKTTDSAVNWNSSNTGILMANVTVVRLDPVSPKKLYAAFYNNGLYKTDDATAKSLSTMSVSWERMPDFYTCHNLEDLIIDPSNPDRMVSMEGGG
ncbi:hypothetical protein ACFL6A_00025 [bacterium]